jgi:aspartate/methionine/tyrosine aminotransferase
MHLPKDDSSMSSPRPSFLMWMKRKIAQGKPDLANLAVSGVTTEFANRWQKDVFVRRATEIIDRSAESNQFGLESLKHAIRSAYNVPSEREIVTSLGASGGYRLVCEMLLAGRTGAEVILESPVYEPLRAIPERLGAKLLPVSRPGDVVEFARAVSDKTVAIVLSNLHNPTGHWLSYEQLAWLAEQLDGSGSPAVVVVDETFLDIGPQPATSAADVHPRIVTISSLSKSHGLPMLRCGWLTADPAALPGLVEDAVLFQNIGGKLAEVLGAMAIEEIDCFRLAAREHLENNRQLMAQWLSEMSSTGLIERQELPPGCIAFPRVRHLGSTSRIVEQLEAQFNVLIAPGSFFGEAYDDRIRIGFGGDHENLKRGLSRLADGLVAIQCRG